LRALEGLNAAQQQAVATVDGPVLILAGPGSGKTRVIVHRIAGLLERGVDPYNILAVTFTNKAAREMRERLQGLVGPTATHLSVGTFHATAARWLRRDIHHFGLDASFAIYDDHDQVDLVKSISRDFALDDKRFTPRALLHEIGSAKSELTGPAEYAQRAEGIWRETVARVYTRYQAALRENRALDFDDLLVYAVRLFQEFPAVLERYQERYRYILVDEFQDTNLVQYQIARLLGQKYRNICVVGDPDQSIYGWRKADIRNILNFEQDYPDLKVVVLEQNYRSTGTILALAHAVLSANRLRKEKNLWTENPSGELVTLFEAFDEREEAQFVLREVERLNAAGTRMGDIAILYRTNAQSRAVEDVFVRYGMPYRLVGGTRFYERKEVKDVLAYLRLVANPYDAVSLQRVVNVPARGIGAKSSAELGRWARSLGVSAYEALRLAAGLGLDGGLEPATSIPFAARAREALRGFLLLLEGLRELRDSVPLPELLNQLFERSGYASYLRDGSEEGEERWANVVELRNKARDYEDLEPDVALQRFLEDVSLVQDVDTLDAESDAVTLITLHAAKGLEFPYVFILGLEEGLCPHVRSFDDPAQLEEERRLLYVGVTRAMRGLYLVYTGRRALFGGSSLRDPSRFLRDIPAELLSLASPRSSARPFAGDPDSWPGDLRAQSGRDRPASLRSRSSFQNGERRSSSAWTEPAPVFRQVRPASEDPEPAWMSEPLEPAAPVARREPLFVKGDQVTHPAFGNGVVVDSHLVGDDEQVTVLFRGHPTPKKLSLSFAPLTRA
jgi:DNA helicase-2/ATP-dependent DNA helicase PcrA